MPQDSLTPERRVDRLPKPHIRCRTGILADDETPRGKKRGKSRSERDRTPGSKVKGCMQLFVIASHVGREQASLMASLMFTHSTMYEFIY